MKRIGQKRVQFQKVVIPGTVNLRKLMSETRVKALAKSFIEDSGGRPLQPPTLDADTFRLVAGADRFAAMKLNGEESAIFELVEGTGEELRRLSIVENLRRRNDDQQRLSLELVQSAERQITQEADSEHCSLSTQSATRPKSVRGAAIERVAKETGKSKAAIRLAVQREEAKHKPADQSKPVEGAVPFVPTPPKPEPPPPPPPPPIKTLSLDVPESVLKEAAVAQAMVEEMSKLFQTLATKLTAFEARYPSLGQQQRAKEGLQQAAHAIRSLRPECVCPHCKALPGVMKPCLGCKGLGYVPKNKLVDIPRELMAEGDDAGVYVGNKWRTVESILAKAS